MIDTDSDGNISKAELRTYYMGKCNQHLSEEALGDIMFTYDLDRISGLDFHKFKKFYIDKEGLKFLDFSWLGREWEDECEDQKQNSTFLIIILRTDNLVTGNFNLQCMVSGITIQMKKSGK